MPVVTRAAAERLERAKEAGVTKRVTKRTGKHAVTWRTPGGGFILKLKNASGVAKIATSFHTPERGFVLVLPKPEHLPGLEIIVQWGRRGDVQGVGQANGQGVGQANGQGIGQANGQGIGQEDGQAIEQGNGQAVAQENGNGGAPVLHDNADDEGRTADRAIKVEEDWPVFELDRGIKAEGQ